MGDSVQDEAVAKFRTALDDLTMPLGAGGWKSCAQDIIYAAPAVLAGLDEARAEIARLRAAVEAIREHIALSEAIGATTSNLANLKAILAAVLGDGAEAPAEIDRLIAASPAAAAATMRPGA